MKTKRKKIAVKCNTMCLQKAYVIENDWLNHWIYLYTPEDPQERQYFIPIYNIQCNEPKIIKELKSYHMSQENIDLTLEKFNTKEVPALVKIIRRYVQNQTTYELGVIDNIKQYLILANEDNLWYCFQNIFEYSEDNYDLLTDIFRINDPRMFTENMNSGLLQYEGRIKELFGIV